MPNEDNEILKHNPGEKSMNIPFIIYADLECLLEKCIQVKVSLKILYRKKYKHTTSDFSLFQYSFDPTKNKLDYYRGKDCMKRFRKDLKERATEIINYEKTIRLTYEENKSY